MKISRFFCLVSFLILFSINHNSVFGQQLIKLDDFETTEGWSINASDQVSVIPTTDFGVNGKGIKIDYNFIAGSGYGGIQKTFPITMPENYVLSFDIKAVSPNNTLEFKLIDKSGDNVWWVNLRNYKFPKEWTKLKFKKRNITKAWGPLQQDKPTEIDKIEIIITSVNGGKGTVFIDNLTLEEKETPDANPPAPTVSASSFLKESSKADFAFDNNLNTSWRSEKAYDNQYFQINFKRTIETGGLKINWDSFNYPRSYTVLGSDNKINWDTLYKVNNGKGDLAFIPIKDCETKHIRLEFTNCNTIKYFEIKEIEYLPIDFSDSDNKMYEYISKQSPKGFYPKYLTPQSSNFTISGVIDDTKEALINEEAQIETDKTNFSIQPSLFFDNTLYTWNELKAEQSLEDNYLPIPIVNLSNDKVNLQTKLFSTGEKDHSVLNAIYTVTNNGKDNLTGKLNLSLIPFQVNPSYQFLNTTGGASYIDNISQNENSILVNDKQIYAFPTNYSFGAVEFDQGYIMEYLINDKLPQSKNIIDLHKRASGVIQYSFSLKPGESVNYYLSVPFHNKTDFNSANVKNCNEYYTSLFNENKSEWIETLNKSTFNLPKSGDKLINTLRSTLAYILINKDNHGFQPGSRSYERSWIRDGSMTSSTLLKLGITKQVKDFVEWYGSYQYPNGKIPCVVDTRGPDPVPENDSHGQFIFAVYQYFLFTQDTAFINYIYPKVVKTVDYIEYLINQRSTDEYKNNPDLLPYFGLMPESISHEGYSDKPMHSHWDNFFTLKGLKDAVEIAKLLKNQGDESRFSKLRDNFRKNLYNSINLSTKLHNIDYIPGCVEKGDFDPTSTTVALYPCNERLNLPQNLLNRTFDKYYEFLTTRRDDPNYEWHNYTPYEIRGAGAFLYLDQPEKTHEALDFFFKDQRPHGWNHWAEVVWRDPTVPYFIGDMPHTWVGSDFITVARSIFIYENEADNSIVLGAGLYKDWIDSPNGIKIKNLRTYNGEINYSVIKANSKYMFNITGDLTLPNGNLVIKNFNLSQMPKSVKINGVDCKSFSNNSITVNQLPALVEIDY